jgi:hypothetical protein
MYSFAKFRADHIFVQNRDRKNIKKKKMTLNKEFFIKVNALRLNVKNNITVVCPDSHGDAGDQGGTLNRIKHLKIV